MLTSANDPSLTTLYRRQRILELLQTRSSVKVTELADELAVSETTIRSDLIALEEAHKLTRVRGGAIPKDQGLWRSPAFAARARVNTTTKSLIARRAAAMVQDGDALVLDASTTVFHMVPVLQERRNLVIITNGIEIALALVDDPTKTIILLGGILRHDGLSITGHLGEKILQDLHAKLAFVSCSGFSIEKGLTEVDIQEGQLKTKMVQASKEVIVLVDADKFGQVDLTVFATLEQVTSVLTDLQPTPAFLERLGDLQDKFIFCHE
jgi:DeoR/GlpR family transcriptional regulator of sugar metabolism